MTAETCWTIEEAFDLARRRANQYGQPMYVARIDGTPYVLWEPRGNCTKVEPEREAKNAERGAP